MYKDIQNQQKLRFKVKDSSTISLLEVLVVREGVEELHCGRVHKLELLLESEEKRGGERVLTLHNGC